MNGMPTRIEATKAGRGLQTRCFAFGASSVPLAALEPLCLVLVIAAGLLVAPGAHAQVRSSERATAANFIVPQSRSFAADRAARAEITRVKVGVVILEQAATTTMDISLRNPTNSRLEAELLIPVPEGATVKAFTFEGTAKEPTAELLPKEEAAATYKSIVAKIKDPALLEFAGYNVVRSSVFPIAPRGEQKVRLTYEHLLTADGDRVDYVLPRTESVDYQVPWEISVRITAKRPIVTVYSPSHQIEFRRVKDEVVAARVLKESSTEPGAFQLSYLQEGQSGVTASLFAYPDPNGEGGYFLLLAGPGQDGGAPPVKRELTIVIDRSGSMSGEKLAQAKAAALQIVEGLSEGEAFNIIDYSDSISSFAPAPVIKTADSAAEARSYLRGLTARGGTNIHDTLIEALRQKPAEGMLPMVLFLTDGLPTVGVRDEAAIRTAAAKANVHQRRIFTFGVGYDVNAPLLTNLARTSRAVSTFVLPNEDVEEKVSQVYRRLSGPVLASPTLAVAGPDGKEETRRVTELMPDKLPDLFEGDQLVLLGRYRGNEPLNFRLSGSYRGRPRTFRFTFKLDKATVRNGFVPRLWASRKIALLTDEIRQAGAPAAGDLAALRAKTAASPHLKELVDEIVRLSVEFGILTEYTAFLAKEGTDLSKRDEVLAQANRNFESRAQGDRSGIAAVNQAINNDTQVAQSQANYRNRYYDRDMNSVQITAVQQVNDRAFFRRDGRWVDGSAINSKAGEKPDQTVTVGSREYGELLQRLTAENRQGVLAMPGEILLRIDGRNILVK